MKIDKFEHSTSIIRKLILLLGFLVGLSVLFVLISCQAQPLTLSDKSCIEDQNLNSYLMQNESLQRLNLIYLSNCESFVILQDELGPEKLLVTIRDKGSLKC